jgi:plasmid stabilization system protein ParE
MKRAVVVLPRAQRQVQEIARWLTERSTQGAARWLDAYDRMIEQLEEQADQCGLAPENEFVAPEIRQIFFKTPRGHTYRALFAIAADNVRILAVRGPGQQLVSPQELTE